MAFLFLARSLLTWVRAAHCQLLGLLTELLNCSFEMLPIVGKFAFCTFVPEELDLAVCKLCSEIALECRFVRSKIFCFGNESDRNALDTFGVTEIGR